MTITLTRKEAQQVLDAMISKQCGGCYESSICCWEDVREAIETLRTRLAEPEPEPVAWMYEFGTDNSDAVNEVRWYKNVQLTKPTGMVRNVEPLYTERS